MRTSLLLTACLALRRRCPGAGAIDARPRDLCQSDRHRLSHNFEQMNEGISYRTGADPAVVTFKGKYYLFQTLADGYWSSSDLVHWKFITPSRWPMRSIVAPAVWT